MESMRPTLDQIDALHRKYAPSQAAYELVHTHCVIVARIARAMVRQQNHLFVTRCTRPLDDPQAPHAPARLIDANLVTAGALLHDIGTYRVFAAGADGSTVADLASAAAHPGALAFDRTRYILHGLLGYELLRSEGVDEELARFCRNHTGLGLTRQAVIDQHLPLPPDDYVPDNPEQEIVMLADKYHTKNVPPQFVSPETAARRAGRFGEENERRQRALTERYGVTEEALAALAAEYGMAMI